MFLIFIRSENFYQLSKKKKVVVNQFSMLSGLSQRVHDGVSIIMDRWWKWEGSPLECDDPIIWTCPMRAELELSP